MVRQGACLSARLVRMLLYMAAMSSGELVDQSSIELQSRLDATSRRKESLSRFLQARADALKMIGWDLENGNLATMREWSEMSGGYTFVSTDVDISPFVMITSSVCPALCVADFTCCTRPKHSKIVLNLVVSLSSGLSRCMLISPVTTIWELWMINISSNLLNSSKKMSVTATEPGL